MAENEFTVSGQRLTLDRGTIERAAAGVVPASLRKHAVDVNGALYPPKQVFAAATGMDVLDFTTNQARRVLARLGFRVMRVEGTEERPPIASAPAEARASSPPHRQPDAPESAGANLTLPHPRPTSDDLALALYRRVAQLPRFDFTTSPAALPEDGIYLFFERGEAVSVDGDPTDRIVRVGTHRAPGRFRARIRQHYGNRGNYRGHKNSSVFRRHVGGALLAVADPDDPRIAEWVRQGGESFPEVEAIVSRHLRDNFTFACVRVDDAAERLRLEKGLIAVLAQPSLGEPSTDWLGRRAIDPKVGRSALWNTQHIYDEPLSADGLARFLDLAAAGPMTGESNAARAPVALGPGRTLVIIPCGKAKVWNTDPHHPPTPARHAYTGPPFKVNRDYAETFGDQWVILSAKYGFVDPDFVITEDYDFTFKHDHPDLVSAATLARQATEMGLRDFDDVIVLGGRHYLGRATRALTGTRARLRFPFEGLTQGRMMGATRRSIDTGNPFAAPISQSS